MRGHRFDWLLLRDEEATHQTTEPEAILHFVRFDDSSYATDPIIGALEAAGYHGDTVLVEGGSTGTAKVSVRFVDRVWKVWTRGSGNELLFCRCTCIHVGCGIPGNSEATSD